jgi:hypothetical protein
MCITYCFCTATMVTRTRLNATFIRTLPVLLRFFPMSPASRSNSPSLIDWTFLVLEQQTIESLSSDRQRTGTGGLVYRMSSCAAGHSDTFLQTPADPSLAVHDASVSTRQSIYCDVQGAVGWGTALQVGRSRVRFPVGALGFFIDLVLPAVLWPWLQLSL